LYEEIASPEFAKSGAEKAAGVTDILRKVLWGIEWLEKLEWSIKSAEIAINEAINYVERNVSKVNVHQFHKSVNQEVTSFATHPTK
jgi:hypothetical protein